MVHAAWFLANQQMEKALVWANAHADAEGRPGPRYDVNHRWTGGGHSDADGGAILSEVLRWIWRDQRADCDPQQSLCAASPIPRAQR